MSVHETGFILVFFKNITILQGTNNDNNNNNNNNSNNNNNNGNNNVVISDTAIYICTSKSVFCCKYDLLKMFSTRKND